MAHILHDEYERCVECNCPDFQEKVVYSFHKAVRPREQDQMHEPLTHLSREIRYFCVQCGHQLNK